MSQLLQKTSRNLVSSIVEVAKDFQLNSSSSASIPLWALQTLLTSIIYASWTGDVREIEYISSVRTLLSSEIKKAVFEFRGVLQSSEMSPPSSWQSFIDGELVIRAYFATFIVFTSLVQIFNYPSPLAYSDIPPNMTLPCSEALWNSIDANANNLSLPNRITYGQGLDILYGGFSADSYSIAQLGVSPMGMRILATSLLSDACSLQVHAMNDNYKGQEHRVRLLSAINTLQKGAVDIHPGQGQLSSQILFNSLPIALSIIIDESLVSSQPSTLLDMIRNFQHPLIISSYFALLLARSRLLIDVPVVRETLRYQVPNDVASALFRTVETLIADSKLSGPAICGLVFKCSEIFRLMLVSGTQTLFNMTPNSVSYPETMWSYFEMITLVIIWCYRYEVDMNNKECNVEPHFDNHFSQNLNEETDDDALYSMLQRTCTETGLEKVHGSVALTLALVASETFTSFDLPGLGTFLSLTLKSFVGNLQSAFNRSPPLKQAQFNRISDLERRLQQQQQYQQEMEMEMRMQREREYSGMGQHPQNAVYGLSSLNNVPSAANQSQQSFSKGNYYQPRSEEHYYHTQGQSQSQHRSLSANGESLPSIGQIQSYNNSSAMPNYPGFNQSVPRVTPSHSQPHPQSLNAITSPTMLPIPSTLTSPVNQTISPLNAHSQTSKRKLPNLRTILADPVPTSSNSDINDSEYRKN